MPKAMCGQCKHVANMEEFYLFEATLVDIRRRIIEYKELYTINEFADAIIKLKKWIPNKISR